MSYSTTHALCSPNWCRCTYSNPTVLVRKGICGIWSHWLMDWKNVHVLFVHFWLCLSAMDYQRKCLNLCNTLWENLDTKHVLCRHVGTLLHHFPIVAGQIVIWLEDCAWDTSFSVLSMYTCVTGLSYTRSCTHLQCIESAMICRCTWHVPVCCHCFDHVEDMTCSWASSCSRCISSSVSHVS